MKKYSKYKDSGVEWIGTIPSHWTFGFLKYLLSKNDGGVWGNDLNIGDDRGTLVIRSTEITIDGNWDLSNPMKRLLTIQEINKSRLFTGDIVITKSSGSQDHIGKSGLVNEDIEKMGCCYSNFVQRIRFRDSAPRLYHHMLNSKIVREQYKYQSETTTGLGNLNASILNEIILPFIPIDEQLQISLFLDQKTSIIDDLIQKKLQKIELLKELRSNTINQAVTRGLIPDAAMKDSGVEWIGEIPAHWVITRLKYNFESTGGGTPSKDIPEYWEGDIPWISPKDMKVKFIDNSEDKITKLGLENSSSNLSESKSLLIVVRSGILQRTIPLGINTIPVAINQDLKSLQPVNCDSVEYLYYFIKGNEENLLIDWSKVGATVESIEMEYFNNTKLPLPPKSEQKEIVEYLDQKTSEIDSQISLESRKIELLKEYRQSLISEVVTGKINVREN